MILVETGQTYDRKSIVAWLERGRKICPLTTKELVTAQLVTNFALKGCIASWREEQTRSGGAHANGERYPNLSATGPQTGTAQVADILNRLKAPSMEVRGTVPAVTAARHWGRFPASCAHRPYARRRTRHSMQKCVVLTSSDQQPADARHLLLLDCQTGDWFAHDPTVSASAQRRSTGAATLTRALLS